MEQDRIIDKIKKCLALSQSPEAHEAAAALRQAQKLMELHGISQGDLSRAELGEEQLRSMVSVSKIKDWELALLNTVARAFGCRLMWLRSNSRADNVYGRYILIGLKSQVELAKYTAAVMQRKLVKARTAFVSQLNGDRPYKIKQADGYCHGWVEAVRKTVHDFAMTKELAALLDETLAARAKGKEAPLRKSQLGAEGYYAGKAAGAGESLHRPLNERQPNLRIGG